MARKKAEDKQDEKEYEHKLYDLDVTAEERGYEVGEQLAPENELREDPLDPDSPKSVNDDEDKEEEDK